MRKQLFGYILNKAAIYFENIVNKNGIYKLAKAKKQPCVFIHDSFVIGNYSEILVKEKINKLEIKHDVVCRKYCNFLISRSASLIIHEQVFFNNYCSVNCLDSIEIGANTVFGEGIRIYDHNHEYTFDGKKLNVATGSFKRAAVKIGSNCWIGSNTTILKGVEIGDNVIVGANCLIHKSIPANSIVKQQPDLITTALV